MTDTFSIKTRLSARRTNSTPIPELIVKGADPLIVITFPNVRDEGDEMIVDVDSTGFEVDQLSAMFHALAHTLEEGKKIAEATGKVGTSVDWDGLEREANRSMRENYSDNGAHNLTAEERAQGLDGK